MAEMVSEKAMAELRGLVALIKGAQGRPFTVAEKAELLIRADELDAALDKLSSARALEPPVENVGTTESDVDGLLDVAIEAWNNHQAACRVTTVSGSLRKVCEAIAVKYRQKANQPEGREAVAWMREQARKVRMAEVEDASVGQLAAYLTTYVRNTTPPAKVPEAWVEFALDRMFDGLLARHMTRDEAREAMLAAAQQPKVGA